MLTARELALEGWQVSLIDRGVLGRESSWAGGGILSPLYPWREHTGLAGLIRFSQQTYPRLAKALFDETGVDPEWIQSGLLILDTEDAGQAMDWSGVNQASLQVLNHKQARTLEPAIRDFAGKAVMLPEAAHIRNSRLIPALKQSLINIGVSLLEHTEVRRISLHNNEVHKIETTQGEFRAKITVMANGAWGSELLPELAIRPIRGQMICYQAVPGLISHIILKHGTYLIPRRDGHILAGSTVEDVGFDKGITDAARKKLSDAAEDIVPGINEFPLVGHWSGLRPATRTGLPYIGKHPAIGGMYLNIGHHRNGILLAPGSARLLGDILMGRKPEFSADPFRFAPG
jgi:glycine oxidase